MPRGRREAHDEYKSHEPMPNEFRPGEAVRPEKRSKLDDALNGLCILEVICDGCLPESTQLCKATCASARPDQCWSLTKCCTFWDIVKDWGHISKI